MSSAVWVYVGDSHDVYFICSSSLSMDSVRYIANHDVLCFLPSETAFWRLAQNEHSSLVGRTQWETLNGQSSRWKECWTPQEEPEKSSISTEEPEELIASLLCSSPRGPASPHWKSSQRLGPDSSNCITISVATGCWATANCDPWPYFQSWSLNPIVAQQFTLNLDVQRGEQVNRSFSAVVFDVEHGLRRFLSVFREQKQGSQEMWLETSRSAQLAI